MTTRENRRRLLEDVVGVLELPESAYESATRRYEDLGIHFSRPQSACAAHYPHIYVQGSFRLGTAIRPLSGEETYDLDITCSLRAGVSTATHTQERLKDLVGYETEEYRQARAIKAPVEEKHRCWRLEYADRLNFHMDVVPCIPGDQPRVHTFTEAMVSSGLERDLAARVASLAVSITDDRHPGFRTISPDWLDSNPEGYAQWFEARMRSTHGLVTETKAQVDDMPLYQRKSSLQRTIQILKRHRDQMFRDNPDVKPISIIITTIAAQAYEAGLPLEQALSRILDALRVFVESGTSQVPNPVNRSENFADRWSMPQYAHLRLRENFHAWVVQANADIRALIHGTDPQVIVEKVKDRLSVSLSASDVASALGVSVAPAITAPKPHIVQTSSPKPWSLG